MDLQRRDEYKKLLLELTPPEEASITNPALREKLVARVPEDTFSQEDYWDLRNSLVDDGLLARGRGRGGSVQRLPAIPPQESIAQDQTTSSQPANTANSEKDLYEPFQRMIESGYVADNDLRPWICEATAYQGRRNTGGLWTRPDVTLIAIQTFPYVPDKLFEVITFEIKPSMDTAMEGVYETVAHSAFAHRSYLAFPDTKDREESALYDRIYDECERFGLGLILFEDVGNWDTYSFELSAQRKEPDPQAVNDFIKVQISDKGKEDIQRWFR